MSLSRVAVMPAEHPPPGNRAFTMPHAVVVGLVFALVTWLLNLGYSPVAAITIPLATLAGVLVLFAAPAMFGKIRRMIHSATSGLDQGSRE